MANVSWREGGTGYDGTCPGPGSSRILISFPEDLRIDSKSMWDLWSRLYLSCLDSSHFVRPPTACFMCQSHHCRPRGSVSCSLRLRLSGAPAHSALQPYHAGSAFFPRTCLLSHCALPVPDHAQLFPSQDISLSRSREYFLYFFPSHFCKGKISPASYLSTQTSSPWVHNEK